MQLKCEALHIAQRALARMLHSFEADEAWKLGEAIMFWIDLKLESAAPLLTTYGYIFKEPQEPKDRPVCENVRIQSGQRSKLKKKLREHTWYRYGFVIAQYDKADDFTLTAHLHGDRTPLPSGTSKHSARQSTGSSTMYTTERNVAHVFRFKVW